MKGHFFHRNDLENILENAIDKTLRQVDVNQVFDKTKENPKVTGIAGDVIEQSVLGFPADNKQRPDLDIDGVDTELKTTGIRLSKKGKKKFEAKEPMSITAVSPDKIIFETFDTSNFWHKLEHMLLVYYHYASDRTVTAAEYADFYIRGYEFYEFSCTDKDRLKNDWELVKNFIIKLQKNYTKPESQYSRISSELRSQLVYIDTAPKWPNPPRFRLKRQVVTDIVQNYFGDRLEQLPGHYCGYQDIDNKCHDISEHDAGKTVAELVKQYNIPIEKNSKVSKSINEPIIAKMFGGQAKKLNKIEMFRKFGIVGKSITMTAEGEHTEQIKLFMIDFDEWLDENLTFEESSFYDYFANHQLLFTLFEEPSKDAPLSENTFKGFKRLSFDEEFIQNEVRKIWDEVRSLVFENRLVETIECNKAGNPFINENDTFKTSINFPKKKDSIVFIRGSGKNSSKKIEEINGIKMYRQYVWISGSYIIDKLKKIELL